MGKHQMPGGKGPQHHKNILSADFDREEVARFFGADRGMKQDVWNALDNSLNQSAAGIGATVSSLAQSGKADPRAKGTDDATDEEKSAIEFGAFISTDEDDLMHHDHDDGHEEPQADNFEFEEFADARGGKKSLDDGGGGGRGKGKKKWQQEEEEEEAAQDPVPTPEPAPEPEPVPAPEPEPEPTPEPEPEPAPEPEPTPTPVPTPAPTGDFGWIGQSTYISGGDTPDGFNLELEFLGSWTASQQDMAAEQSEILSDLIVCDLEDYGDIDDVRILLINENIDGSGGVWGQGGWTQMRADGMVAQGGVRLDSNDIGTAENMGMLDELMMHEMLHAVGFGTAWPEQGLVYNNTFIGENAVDVYGAPVPIDGNGHLSESVGNEMGTTYISNGAEPITDLTEAILQDMGFETVSDSDPMLAAAIPEEPEDEETVIDDFMIL